MRPFPPGSDPDPLGIRFPDPPRGGSGKGATLLLVVLAGTADLALARAAEDGRLSPVWVYLASLWILSAATTAAAAWARRSRRVAIHLLIGLLLGPLALYSSYLLYLLKDLRGERGWRIPPGVPRELVGSEGPPRRVRLVPREAPDEEDEGADDEDEKGPPPTFH